MPRLDFSYNWNKKLTANRYFTTIRRREFLVPGDAVDIYLDGKKIMKAMVIKKQEIKLWQLRTKEYICYLDTGYSAKETIEILKKMHGTNSENTTFYVYLLECVVRYDEKEEYRDE
ncbi:MAG: hypothetical protein NZ455_02510 [Bacteroidia bacterium]|nr:hypothetical protein [Bacteroidia bacterium]MDW8347003.1 hypothetical protein [Bacteroidia bacterium]